MKRIIQTVGLFCRAIIVGWWLAEKNNAWWWWDAFKDVVMGTLCLIGRSLAFVLTTVVLPIRTLIEWKQIDKAAVDRFWNKWFHKPRPTKDTTR